MRRRAGARAAKGPRACGRGDLGRTGETSDGELTPEAAPRYGDQTQIDRTLTLVLTGNDPGLICGDLVTERYLRRSFGDVSGCRAAQAQIMTVRRARVDQVVVLRG